MEESDVLSGLLRQLRFRANVFFHSSYCGSWAVDTSGSGRSTFHLIASGNCYLHLPKQEQATPLSTGDLVVFPRDSKHRITDNAEVEIKTQDDTCIAKETTALICGYFDFDDPQRNPIINALPDTVLVKGNGNRVEPRLQVLIDLMKSEIESSITGSDVVVDKLSEILFIYALRSFISEKSPQSGILAALSNTYVARALEAIHDKPEHSWTVDKLANVAGLSRAAFSKHFSELMDQPPMTYVGEWRMQLANTALREGKKSMLDIAGSVGYSSEVAFRKAFKQITGITPGAARNMKINNSSGN